MNMQQAFNKAYLGVIKQGYIARDDYGTCAYRYQSGRKLLKCGIGHLLAKKDYNPEMERKEVRILADRELLPPNLNRLPTEFLADLQDAHDNVSPVSKTQMEDFKKNMRVVADKYDLTVPC